MTKINNLDILKEMSARHGRIMFAPLDNITYLRKVKAARLEDQLEDFDCPHDAEHRCQCAKREENLIHYARQTRKAAIAKASRQ